MTGGPNRKLVRLVSNLTFAHHGEVERWLPVVGWEGLYDVSSLGRVRSLDRVVEIEMPYGHTVRHYRGRMLRQQSGPGSHGYLTVVLSRQGKGQKTKQVHQLVAVAFLDPCPPGEEVRHGPNGKLDNRASQLCYGTHRVNTGQDKVRDGTVVHGEQHVGAKLTDAIVAECKRRYAAGERQTALAAEFRVSRRAISKAIRGDTWKHVRLAA